MFYQLALKILENLNNDISLSFKDSFPNISQLQVINTNPSLRPVTACIPDVGKTTALTEGLVLEIQKTYQNQAWRQPYNVEDFGNEFYHKSAWFPIADTLGPVVYSDGLIEIMLLDAGLTYPKHKHAPEELYIVLAGEVWWEAEDKKPCWIQSGDFIHHPSNVAHSIRAGNRPVLILNLWRGGGFELPAIINNNA